MTEVVVSDTSPLQYLHQSGRLELLPRLFDRVIVPPAVIGELAEGRARGHDLPRLDGVAWVDIQAPHQALVLPDKLGRGEQEAMAVAVERHLMVLMDDRDARTAARSLGLHTLGTFGVLLRAKQAGLIPVVAPLVDQIVGLGFRLDAPTRQMVLELAGEG
jgi:predicted nucleic acid-binding protein